MKYYLICGEASGDLHAAALVSELKKLDNKAEFRGFGGDLLAQEGMHIVQHYKDHSYIGISEIIGSLPKILKSIKDCKLDIYNWSPDVVIHVDYPGFNMRIGKFVHRNKIKNAYYIPPQMWAWNKSRVKKVKQYFDKVMVILPFEKSFYQKEQLEVEYCGHPLVHHMQSYDFKNIQSQKPIIALLPGSRPKEIKSLLPTMLELSKDYPNYQFIIGGLSALDKSIYNDIIIDYPEVNLIFDQTYDLIKSAKAAIVASGTASLETALIGTPQLVVYKTSRITYFIGKMLAKVKFISLVNLISNKEVVKELIQDDFNNKLLIKELNLLLDEKNSNRIKSDYDQLRKELSIDQITKTPAQIIFEMR